MRILWNEAAKRALGHLADARRATVESESAVMFADAVPGDAKRLTDGTMFIELPCGNEVVFERIGDGVQIIMVVGTLERTVKTEREFLRRMTA